jgi:hypothetical protein
MISAEYLLVLPRRIGLMIPFFSHLHKVGLVILSLEHSSAGVSVCMTFYFSLFITGYRIEIAGMQLTEND